MAIYYSDYSEAILLDRCLQARTLPLPLGYFEQGPLTWQQRKIKLIHLFSSNISFTFLK
jgi:hypothetical protein